MQYLKRITSFLALPALLLGTTATVRAQAPTNLALSKPALASAIEANNPAELGPQRAVDGDQGTRWAAGAAGEQWWAVDLGSTQAVRQIRITWEAAYAVGYDIMVSNAALPATMEEFDISGYTSVFTEEAGNGGLDVIALPANTQARSVAIALHTQGPFATYSFFEFQVYGEGATLSGTVSDASGPVANAQVSATGPNDTQRTVTDESGNYTINPIFPGTYTVTAYAPGKYAPSTANVTLTNGQAGTQNFTLSTPIVLTPFTFPFYNADWIAIEGQANDYSTGIFDTAYAIESLPQANPAPVNGINYQLGPSATGANNVFAVSGATFFVPAGNYTAIHTLDSSAGGIYNGTVTLNYADGTSQSSAYTVSDWFGNPVAGEDIGIPVTYRLDAAGAKANEGSAIKIFHYIIFADPAKVLQSISFSAPNSTSSTTTKPYLFAMTLESTAALPAVGTISGQVTGTGGAAVANATVRVGPYETTTNATGNYTVVGLPAGNYAVTAFKTGQFAPVSQNATLAVGGTQTVNLALSAAPQFVSYPLFFTHDWASSEEVPGDFYAVDTGYPAAGDTYPDDNFGKGALPPAGPLTPENVGIAFQFPNSADGVKNTVLVNGQTMAVPPAHYSALYLLESCGAGSYSGNITLRYSDGTTENVSATFTDWFGNPSAKEKVAWQVNHRHGPGNPTANANSQIKIFAETLPVNYNKVLASITLPKDPAGHQTQTAFIWAMTLEAIDAPQSGTVTGKVTGPGGNVPNATVTLGGFGQVVTDAQGNFTIANAPVGAGTVTVTPETPANLNGGTASVTVTAGQSATANVTLTAGPTQVYSQLGAANNQSGLRQLEDAGLANSVTSVVTEVGQAARRFTGRLYFDVADSFLHLNSTVNPVYVQIEYLDRGTDTFQLRYNSSDVTIGDYGRYARGTAETTITKENSNTWKTVVLEIADAGFYNGIELGADFFIDAQTDPEVIRSVIVSKDATIEAIPAPTGCKGDANGDKKIDVNDAVAILRHATSISLLTGQNRVNADIDGPGTSDASVNVADAVKVLQFIVNIPGTGISACQ